MVLDEPVTLWLYSSMKDFDLTQTGVVVPAGRTLRINIQSDALSDEYQWIAYDTTAYPSRLSLGSW